MHITILSLKKRIVLIPVDIHLPAGEAAAMTVMIAGVEAAVAGEEVPLGAAEATAVLVAALSAAAADLEEEVSPAAAVSRPNFPQSL